MNYFNLLVLILLWFEVIRGSYVLLDYNSIFISRYKVNKFIVVYIVFFWISDVMVCVIILWDMGRVGFMRLFIVVI